MLDRKVAPPVQPLARVTLPAADVFLLPNGARLHVMRNSAQPVVRLQVVFKAGKWYEPAPGVSLLTARMLLEGTRTRTTRQIADEVAFYGASLECEQGFDRATLTLYCLTRHLQKLLPLVLDVLTEPTFPESELALLKTRTIQNVRVERQKTSYLAAEQFSNNLFGAHNPYGSKFDEATFQLVTTEQVREFHRQAYDLAQSEIFLCGDITAEHDALVKRSLGTYSTSNVSAQLQVPAAVSVVPSEHDYVPVKDSLQASLRIGRLWPALSHPQVYELQVLVKVLGGYFGSRLMKNIREDKGFTYGIYASISPREHATSFVISSDVNAASADAAIKEVHSELTQLQNELIPADELQTVKNYMTGKFANELSTVFEQCDKYKTIVFYQLPDDYYNQFVERIQAVEAATLLALAQQYLSPTSMHEVIAGPKA
ncbi:putative Zn-dependent peptidase [Hymenobacter luteus]|uniref:Zn-dependent peptidase n=2 Tax=Hymenobacter TaxID=89966 RepID=A0ABR6K148_9BACT|nr:MULTISPECIES: pitrilysin family protein [Hymenobacter]MBB4602812.1 putative Zn-dependent peptidase [Hymenobacter latericoloratus]MBB6060703.1 putative Zn-dependent peptidase [Hymenobacter luteus]